MAGVLERSGRLVAALAMAAAVVTAVPPSASASGVPPVGADDDYVVVMDGTLASDATWHHAGWGARRQITFANGTRSALSDVPILVSLDSNRIDYGRTQNLGQDLRFVDSDGTPLDHEIEQWDESGTSVVWVRVPTIDATNVDHIFMYYGNSGAVDGQNPSGVWNSGYVGVWHLGDDPTGGAGSIGDSTSYANDGDPYNLDASNLQPGAIGDGLSFAGLTAPNVDHIRIPSDGVDELSITGTELTVEAWVNRTGDTTQWMQVVGRQIGTTWADSWGLLANVGSPTQMVMAAANDSVTSPLPANAIPTNDWRYLAGVRDGSSLFAYSNGAEVAQLTGLATSIVTDANDITIGGAENDGTPTITEAWLGMLDEIRISDVVRSPDWIDAQHASMDDTLSAFGPETVPGVLINDTDAEFDTLTAVNGTPPSNALSFGLLADGSFNYTPTAGFTGVDSFTYTANDGTGSSQTTTVTITVYDKRFVVNSTGDAGDTAVGDGLCDTGGTVGAAAECTLRAAIQQANNSTELDLVDFAIPTTDAGYSASPLAYTLTPGSPYDYIDWPLVLDASTQPGFVDRPIIQLDGSSAGAATAALALRTNDSSIVGFIAHAWPNDDGLEIDGSTGNGDNNTISGNWVGVDADETASGIGDFGILVTHGAVGNRVHGNVVAASATGIGLRVTATAGNVVTANLIGIAPDGVTAMPNTTHGVFIEDTATGNMVGGSSPADANSIAFNGADGVHVATDAGDDNAILGNDIYSNIGLGIDRAGGTEDGFGVTANGSGGPNDAMNHPDPTGASEAAGTVTVDFDLDAPAGDYRIEVFTNPSGADPSGHGEGESFEAAATISHTGSGVESFQIAYSGSSGDAVTLTATEESAGPVYGSTSEFSAVHGVDNLAPSADAGGPYSIAEGDPLPLDGSGSSDPDLDTLTYAWDLDNDTFYDDATTVGPTVPWLTLAGLGLDDDGGPLTIGLQVDDGLGLTATDTATLTIANTAPEITVDGPDSIEAYAPYVVTLGVTDPGDDTVTEWTINWGDGTIDTISGNPTSASHIYTRPGLTFPIIASVVDDDGTWHDNRMVVPGLFSGQQLFRLEATTGAVFDNIGSGTGIGGAITAIIGPDDLLYVGSYTTDDIRRYNPVTGAYLGIWVTAGSGGLNGPAGMMFGPDGDLYVASNFSDAILRVDYSDPTNVTTFVPTNSGGLDEPDDMIFGPNGDLYVTSFNTDEVLRYDGTTGAPKGAFVSAGSGGLNAPSELLFGPDGNLYVTSVATDQVIRYNGTTGAPMGVFASDPQLDQPRGAIFGPDGHLYVGGRTNIIRFDGTNGGSPFVYVPNGVINGPSQSVFVPSEQADVLPCADTDSDGLCDLLEDADTDADGDPTTVPGPDTDSDLAVNYLDNDDDDDGTPTSSENADPNGDGDQRDAADADRDGQPDYLDDPTSGSSGTVATAQKISETQGLLPTTLGVNDHFGRSVASIGDVDGDGINDIAVGAHWDDDGSSDRGAVYILFLNADGTVKAEQKISDTAGLFTATLDNSDEFGIGVAGLGDLDGDLIPDIAVGSHQDDDGANGNGGAVYILLLNSDGTVKSHQKISETEGDLGVLFAANDRFGSSVANVGDINGDGLNDIVVGAKDDDDGGANKGAVYVLFLDADGTVKAHQKISEGTGGLAATLAPSGGFGIGVAGLGDLDGDGTNDIAVGNYWDDDGGTNHGAVHVLFLNANGTVKGEQKISDTVGGLAAVLASNDEFGTSVSGVGDVDADGVPDLIVGAPKDDDGNSLSGAAYLLFLNANGTVKDEQKISNLEGSLGVTLNTSDQFGFGVAGLGDLDGDGTIGIAVGVYGDDDGGPADRGAVYVLDLDPAGSTISGTVFEDIAGDLLVDGAIGSASNPGSVGVDVHLWDITDTLIASTVTDASGNYSFTGLPDSTYTVWVDSTTVPSAQDPTALQGDIWAEQTYGPFDAPCANGSGSATGNSAAGSCYAGISSALSDSLTLPLHRLVVPLSGADVSAVDFGFSFNVVTTSRGGDGTDDDLGANRSVQGSLRQLIQNANAIAGPNAMRFVPTDPIDLSIGADDWWRIGITNPLPIVSAADTTIDGTAFDLDDGITIVDTNSLGPELELDGFGSAVGDDGLRITGGTATIRGLVINRFGHDGIHITTAGSNTIVGNYIGTDAIGTADAGNGNDGIRIISTGSNQIGGINVADRNVISGNDNNGLLMDGAAATGNIVEGNYVGLNAAGTAAIANADDGVDLSDAPGNTIGGAAPGAGNVISGQGDVGLLLVGAGSTGNVVQGNRIGTNALGTAPVPNLTGVGISGGASANTIGGTTSAHGNLISENTVYGIDISGAGSDSNVVSANLIGTDVTGTADHGNGNDGIAIRSGAQNNIIGGTTVGERNVISGNDNDGVWITGVGTDGNSVIGNWIGFGSDSSPLGNAYHGVAMENGAADNIVGGDVPATQNRIGNSGWDGVAIGGSGTGNSVLGNSIVSNTGIGIDLEGGTEDGFGVSANGTGVTNHPVITSAVEAGGTVTVDFDLDAPAGDYRVEAFTNASGLDPSGYGEGETFEDAAPITHTGSGLESFQIVYSGSSGGLVALTATSEATGPVYGETSEFSAGFTVVATVGGAISGSVQEDVDGDGDILDDGAGVAGVQVWVFSDQGNGEPDAGDPVAATTVTDGLGDWSVSVPVDGTYWVAVDSTDIEPAAGYNVTFSRDDVWADQTYGSPGAVTYDGISFSFAPATGPLFGGRQAAVADGFPSLARAQHVHRVIVSGADVTGIDSGFSFQVVTNTGDELDPGAFATVAAWDTYDPGANGVGVDPDGYRGIADDGRYLYFAPYGDGVTYHGEVLRYDTTGPFTAAGSWSAFDPGANGVGATPDGYAGALFDGRYIFFSPYGSRHGEVLRYDTQAPFAAAGSWSAFDPGTNGVGTDPDGYLGLTWDGRYVYFSPYNNGTASHGEVLRYDTQATFAAAGSWTTYDPGANGVGADADGFIGAGFDGRYVYFVPFNNGTANHGEVLRFDTRASFNVAGSWSAFDPGANGVGTAPDGYAGVVFDGRHLYFVPNQNAGGRHGEVLRYDTQATFAAAGSWSAFDPGANGVGIDPDGFRGGTYDGRYVYFVPYDNGAGRHGEVLRYDTAASFGAAAAWSTFDAGANGVGTDPDGYGRAVFAGRHVYFSPTHNGSGTHGEVLRYDTGRTGQGTIRQFIGNSEALNGTQTSQFVIPSTDAGHTASPLAYTIQPVADLPTAADTVVIDGTTQPDYPGTPIIELDGSLAPTAAGLTLTSSGSTVRGLVINRFTTGIAVLGGANNTVVGNYLGPDVTGLAGEVGNTDEGVMVFGGSGTIIGGSTAADRNVISANRLRGVLVDDFSDGAPVISSGTRVIGNYIGTNVDGSAPLPFNGAGDAQQIGLCVLDAPAGDLGGPGLEGNVISGNDWYGIYLWGPNATGNTIQGNIIGLDESGAFSVGNGADDPATRSGVLLSNTSDNLIGGAVPGEGNTIAGNDAKGVIITAPAAVDNAIVANLIYSNVGIGIDLAGGAEDAFGVTSNDPGDSGPNDLLDYPVITSATASGPIVTVSGTYDVPAGDYRFDFFTNPSGGDGSGHGEGEVLAATSTLNHSGAGPEPFSRAFTGSVGDVVSVTITEVSTGPVFGSTSEFSATATVVDSSGSATDSSGRRSDVFGLGGVDLDTPAGGLVANGFDLAGSTERVVGPATEILASELTLSGWVRLDVAGTAPRIVAKTASDGSAIYELLVDDGTSEAVARLNIGGGTVEVRGGTIPTGSWHQVAATWDGATVRLYVDGSQVDTAAGSGALGTDLSVPLVVGNIASADRGVDGRLDQIEVSHTSQSAARIATSFANVSNPSAFITMGAAQTSAPQPWTVSTSLGRTGSNSLAAPETMSGADAWATAIGVDEPGIEFTAWWQVSDPSLVAVAGGSRTGVTPTDQNETELSVAGFDLATLVGATRTQEATSPATIGVATWAEVLLRTDELGNSSVWVDGVQIIGPTAHSGGAATGSVGLRSGNIPVGETWNIDDVRLRRLVSDEPITSLGPLDRN